MKNLLYIPLAILLLACNSTETSVTDSFNLISEGKGLAKPKTGDVLTISLKYVNANGEVVVDKTTTPVRMPLSKPVFVNDVNYYLAKLHVGDSASFEVSADSIYKKVFKSSLPANVESGSNLTFYVKLLRIEGKTKTGAELNIERDEKELMNNFMAEQGIDFAFTESGLRYFTKVEGRGARPKIDDEVRIKYVGKFLNGKVFDSSKNNNIDFEILIGRGDVIKGIEEGLTYMKKGGKSIFIVPSYLAFGKQGPGGIIPPNTPLLFEVELLKILQN